MGGREEEETGGALEEDRRDAAERGTEEAKRGRAQKRIGREVA